MSVYVKDANKIDDTVKELKKMNLKTLKISDTLVNDGFVELMKVFKTVTTIILVVTLFFISYFISEPDVINNSGGMSAFTG